MNNAFSNQAKPFNYLTEKRVALLERLSKSRSNEGVPLESSEKQIALALAESCLVTLNREHTHARICENGRGTLRAYKKAHLDVAKEAPAPQRRSRRP